MDTAENTTESHVQAQQGEMAEQFLSPHSGFPVLPGLVCSNTCTLYVQGTDRELKSTCFLKHPVKAYSLNFRCQVEASISAYARDFNKKTLSGIGTLTDSLPCQ